MKRIIILMISVFLILLSFSACVANENESSSESAAESNSSFVLEESSETAEPSAESSYESSQVPDYAEYEVAHVQLNGKNDCYYTADTFEEGAVVPAVSYKKPIISDYSDYEDQFHNIYIPKVQGDTDAIKAFNQKIYDTYSNAYETLLEDEEENTITNIGYEFKVYNNVVSIMVFVKYGWQMSEYGTYCDAYYFDLDTDKELDFNSYLVAVGLTSNDIAKLYAADSIRDFLTLKGFGLPDSPLSGSVEIAKVSAMMYDKSETVVILSNVPDHEFLCWARFDIEN